MPKKSRSYEVGLHERLRDIRHAVNYIKAAAEDSIEGFLLALRDFAEATKGMGKVAADADKNRENLYRMLSEEGNPRLNSLWAVVRALGLRITVEQIEVPTNTLPGATEPEVTSLGSEQHSSPSNPLEPKELSGLELLVVSRHQQERANLAGPYGLH